MSVTYGFYNSHNGDRKYNANSFSDLIGCLIHDGIFKGYGSEFVVTPNGGTTVKVGSGRAWFNGTWIFNDSDLTINVPLSPLGLYYRAHLIVIEIDLVNRVNSIKLLEGPEASYSGVLPTISNGDNGVYHYPLCRIQEEPDMTSIGVNDIFDRRGDGFVDCYAPFVDTSFTSVNKNSVGFHRNTFRGKCLGHTITAEQIAAIRRGDFTDFYIGDYWAPADGKGSTWCIADIDYWLRTGQTANDKLLKQHHLVLVPAETVVGAGLMDLTTITSTSIPSDPNSRKVLVDNIDENNWADYASADEYMWHTEFKSLFGTDVTSNMPLIAIDDWEVTKFNEPYFKITDPQTPSYLYSLTATVDLAVERRSFRLLNEPMVFGGFIHAPHGNNRFTVSNRQLALFRLRPDYINIGYNYWLRDIASNESLIMVHASGTSYPANANASSGSTAYFRPVIAVG